MFPFGHSYRPALRPPVCPGSGAAAPAWPGLLLFRERSSAGAAVPGVDRGQRQRLRPWDGLSGVLPLILDTSGHVAGQRNGRQLRPALRPPVAAAGLLGALDALQALRRGLGPLLIRERSSAGRCARRGSREAAAPSALGWSIGAAAADPGRVRPRRRADRRAATPARSAAAAGLMPGLIGF